MRTISLWSADVSRRLRAAGYNLPASVEGKLRALSAKGRDAVLLVGEGTGMTAAFILPLLPRRAKLGKIGIKAVIFTPNREKARRIFQELSRFCGLMQHDLTLHVLDYGEERQREPRYPARPPAILIGTPERVIDHIRRRDLDFASLQTVVVEAPAAEESEGFIDDLHFIYSKLPQKVRTYLFSSKNNAWREALGELLERPLELDTAVEAPPPESGLKIDVPVPPSARLRTLERLVLARDWDNLLIICRQREEARRLASGLKALQLRLGLLEADLPLLRKKPMVKAFLLGRCILVSYPEAVREPELEAATHLILLDPAPKTEALLSRTAGAGMVLRLLTSSGTARRQPEGTGKDKEQTNVMKPEDFPTDEQVVAGFVRKLLTRSREEGGEELEALERILKRNVPLFQRSRFAAFLVKATMGKAAPASLVPTRPQKPATGGRGAGEPIRSSGPEPSPAGRGGGEPGKRRRLFINVGKAHGIHSRDLSSFLAQKLNLPPSRIAGMKVLSRFSFVELPGPEAERAVAELSGSELKGKRIGISFARGREKNGAS